jgi:hypothetical protein
MWVNVDLTAAKRESSPARMPMATRWTAHWPSRRAGKAMRTTYCGMATCTRPEWLSPELNSFRPSERHDDLASGAIAGLRATSLPPSWRKRKTRNLLCDTSAHDTRAAAARSISVATDYGYSPTGWICQAPISMIRARIATSGTPGYQRPGLRFAHRHGQAGQLRADVAQPLLADLSPA